MGLVKTTQKTEKPPFKKNCKIFLRFVNEEAARSSSGRENRDIYL